MQGDGLETICRVRLKLENGGEKTLRKGKGKRSPLELRGKKRDSTEKRDEAGKRRHPMLTSAIVISEGGNESIGEEARGRGAKKPQCRQRGIPMSGP